MVPTNHAVDENNHYCQLVRIGEGQLDPNSPSVRAGVHTIYVGDEIATRDNDPGLPIDRGRMVRNRAEWSVTAIYPDGPIDVDGAAGASGSRPNTSPNTSSSPTPAPEPAHKAAPSTLRSSISTDPPTHAYVPMTRGRSTNEVFVATSGGQTALDVVAQSIAANWFDRPPSPSEQNSKNERLRSQLSGDEPIGNRSRRRYTERPTS